MAQLRVRRKPMAEINVVPYIDVMLVLLVIFMVTTPLLTQGVKVELPKANSQPVPDQEEPLVVSIKADGSHFINLGKDGQQEVSIEEVTQKVKAVLEAKPNTPVLIWGDANVSYGVVVTTMAALQVAGVSNVGLVTEPGPQKKS